MPTERQEAEHAGLWKADRGEGPHYSRAAIAAAGLSCWACPLDGCEWHYDVPIGDYDEPAVVDAMFRTHLDEHDTLDFLRSLRAAREAGVAVREANDRAWEVVQLCRLRATERGDDPYADPAARVLSAALVGDAEHGQVRDEVSQLGGTALGGREEAPR